jgi:hypothetical protein
MDQQEPELECCDFESVADEIKDMLRMNENEAAARGEEAYYDPKFLAALYPFLETPSRETAGPLLQLAPMLSKYFPAYKPGGTFHDYKKVLGDLARHSGPVEGEPQVVGTSLLRSAERTTVKPAYILVAFGLIVFAIEAVSSGSLVGFISRLTSPLGIAGIVCFLVGLGLVGQSRRKSRGQIR